MRAGLAPQSTARARISGRALTANGGSASRRADGSFPRWDERRAGLDQRRVASVRRAGFDDSSFSRVQVPSHLETAGLLAPQYVNVQYPWDGHEDPKAPAIPEHGHVAVYRREFDADGEVAQAVREGRPVTLTFQARPQPSTCGSTARCCYAEDSSRPASST